MLRAIMHVLHVSSAVTLLTFYTNASHQHTSAILILLSLPILLPSCVLLLSGAYSDTTEYVGVPEWTQTLA